MTSGCFQDSHSLYALLEDPQFPASTDIRMAMHVSHCQCPFFLGNLSVLEGLVQRSPAISRKQSMQSSSLPEKNSQRKTPRVFHILITPLTKASNCMFAALAVPPESKRWG